MVSFDADEERPAVMFVIPLFWKDLGSPVMGIVVVKVTGDEYRRIGRFENGHNSREVTWLEGLVEQEVVLV